MLPNFTEENSSSRLELKNVVDRLADNDFERPVGNSGWTVSTLLCHLAFWDLRVLYVLKEWQNPDFQMTRLSQDAIDSINHACRALFQAIPGRAAAQLALESAETLDAKLEQLSADVATRIVAAGFERLLRRSLHRREHLQKIKEAL